MESLILASRWPGLVLLVLGGLLLSWRLLAPELEPKKLLRRGRGRFERALVPLVGTQAAPEVAGAALTAGGIALLTSALLLALALGPVGRRSPFISDSSLYGKSLGEIAAMGLKKARDNEG